MNKVEEGIDKKKELKVNFCREKQVNFSSFIHSLNEKEMKNQFRTLTLVCKSFFFFFKFILGNSKFPHISRIKS